MWIGKRIHMARVMFVDDDPLTLETLQKATQIFGHEAFLAETGRDALRMASQQPPDLIFVDKSLPDMDGFKLVRELSRLERTQNVPILMLSAGPELDSVDAARSAGARDYLSKPIRLHTLLVAIKKYTEK